ncbi:MAG: hypothetical protein C4520_16590 [Candidatus Abyssobacteria bacterium SURF_5]|uniref:Thioredoxin domain-containing protein n=1 Tax=Abyssobacteria bacterium (strain SURF_5) TaxID=2093360 RepID=A0A3A4N6G1_ABYX5|nr:MAG: hypothetical protein C4520_16590 [Candidatus Abyssubacteria bacterium SURF_5]
MRLIRRALLLEMVFALVLFGTACKQGTVLGSAAGSSPQTGENESDLALSAILFVNEMSCPCTREQCRVAEGIVQALKADFSSRMRFKTIDYELENETAKPLMEKYDAIMLPVLVVLEGDRLVWLCEDFSDENAVRAKIEELVLRVDNQRK